MLCRSVKADCRDIKAGSVVSDENGYYDSQNIIVCYDKIINKRVISCVLHHSENHEGGDGLALFHTRSEDDGKTWGPLVPIEKGRNAPQSHDGYQLLIGERIYLFYGCNKGSQPPTSSGQPAAEGDDNYLPRTDMQLDDGFWMCWSDDYGISFKSEDRVCIPVPRTAIDRLNPWGGQPTIGAFCCDKPQVINNSIFFAFQKTRDGNGESYGSEVFFMRCDNLLPLHFSGDSPQKTTWQMLPRGDRGLQTPYGLLLGEEPHVVHVKDKRLLCLWRTEIGILDSAYSDDFGETWMHGSLDGASKDAIMHPLFYGPLAPRQKGIPNSVIEGFLQKREELSKLDLSSGLAELSNVRDPGFQENLRLYLASEAYAKEVFADHSIMRNPRGAITPFSMQDGYVCLLYYNNGHTDRFGYVGRLVLWLVIGKTTGSGNAIIQWGQPELCLWWDGVLLDDREDWNEDWAIVDGSGYADFQELGGHPSELILVASNKLAVRFHRVDPYMVEMSKSMLQVQVNGRPWNMTTNLLQEAVFSWRNGCMNNMRIQKENISQFRAPVLPDLRSGGGFTILLWMDLAKLMNAMRGHAVVRVVSGLSTVSAALDEPLKKNEAHKGVNEQATHATITKGYDITFDQGSDLLRLHVTDGFKVHFDFEVDCKQLLYQQEYYGISTGKSMTIMLAFILDGGPKVCSCVVQDKLYNAAPCGWKFLPRDMGEIGGSNVQIPNDLTQGSLSELHVFDRALLTNECVSIFHHYRPTEDALSIERSKL